MNKELERIIDNVNKLPLLEGNWWDLEGSDTNSFAFYKIADGRNYLFYYFDELVEESSAQVAEKILSTAELGLEIIHPSYIAQDTYVVFLSKVETHVDYLKKFIIRIEENEYMFKKYVCLFTEAEIKAVEEKLPLMKKKNEFWGNESLASLNSELHSQLLLRLAIKVPIIKLNFAEIQFDSIQNRVIRNIVGRENQDKLTKLNGNLISWCGKTSPEEIANNLFKEIVGDDYEF